MTTLKEWTRATFFMFQKIYLYLFCHMSVTLKSLGQDLISTYEQKKLIVHADSQITPTASARSPSSLVICPLPTHPTEFLQNVAHFS